MHVRITPACVSYAHRLRVARVDHLLPGIRRDPLINIRGNPGLLGPRVHDIKAATSRVIRSRIEGVSPRFLYRYNIVFISARVLEEPCEYLIPGFINVIL